MKRSVCFMLVLAVVLVESAAAQTEWLMINGNPQRSSFVASENWLRPPLRILKRFSAANANTLTATVDQLFIGSGSYARNTGFAYALATGAQQWSFAIDSSGGGMNFAPTIFESFVYLGGQNGLGLYALDRITGAIRWFKPIGSLYDRYVVHDGQSLFVVRDSLFCLSPFTGETRWTYPTKAQGTPLVDNSIVVVKGSNALLALNKQTGAKMWEQPYQGYSITMDELHVYSQHKDSIVARRKSDGGIVWRHYSGAIGTLTSSLAVSDQSCFYVSWENAAKRAELHALDRMNGSRRWMHEFKANGIFTPTIANGVVYLTTYSDGKLWALDAANGSILLQDSSAQHYVQPIIIDHKLIVGSTSGVVTIFDRLLNGVDGDALPPARLTLDEPFPNPAGARTDIDYRVPLPSHVTAYLYDRLGNLLRLLRDEDTSPCTHTLQIDASNLPDGCYFVAITDGRQQAVRKMIVAKR